MRLWRHVQEDGLVLEEVLPGTAVDGLLFLEFDCPGCDEFYSVTCDCSANHEVEFMCECVPADCPSCGYELRSEISIPLDDVEPIVLDEASYK